MDIFLTGLVTGLSLIVAIGAQNAWVLRQGLRRSYMGVVVAICAVADMLLIFAGTLGIGAIVERASWVLVILTWAGVAYLCWFAYQSFRSALHPDNASLEASQTGGSSLRTVVLTTLAITWLNPHVYLDTMVFLGSLANQHGPSGRWIFAVGAMTGSILWFSALGFGAFRLSKPLSSPKVWRGLDAIIGVVMIGIAVKLAMNGVQLTSANN